MLVIPALATLIYAAFVRFTRMLDLKDKKMLERLQEEKQEIDGEPREFNQNDQNSVQNCDDVDGASNSLVANDSMAHNSKLRKHRQSSINLRHDGGDDMSWGHSKDFQPMPSDGLRQRRFSSGKTYMTNNSATESSEEKTLKTPSVSAHSIQHGHAPISTEDTVLYPFVDSHHSRPAISIMLAEPANIHQELPAGDGEEERFDGLWDTVDTHSSSSKENPITPVGYHNSFCDRDDSRLSEHGVSSLSTVFQELLVKVREEHSLSLPEKLEFSPVFIKEAPASPPDYCVDHSSLNDLRSNPSDPVLNASETFEKLPAEGVKEEALLDPHKSAGLQAYSFISEDIPTPCAIDDNGVIISSDEETYPLPSICSNIHGNAAIVDIDRVSPKLNFPPELLGEGVEEDESSRLHVLEGNRTLFNSEEVSVCPLAVKNIEHCMGTPEFSLCSQEIEEMEASGSVSFIKLSRELSFLSSLELVVEGDEDAREKETCELNTKEDDGTLINLEEKALPGELVVSNTEQCLEISEFSLCGQDAEPMEVPGIVYFATVSPELNYPASPELLAEGDEDSKDDGMYDLHLHEQKGLNLEKEPFLDPLAVDTAEDSLVTSEFLLCSEEVQMAEVHGIVEEVLSESEEGAFNHRKLVVTSADDDSNAQSLVSNLMSTQFIPDTNIKEAIRAGQETLSELPHGSICHSEGIFLSSGEIGNDEVEVEAPFAGQGGLSKSEDEMAFTSLDTPILLDEVRNAENMTDNSGSSQCLPDSNGIQSLHDGKQPPSETLQKVTFRLEESAMSSDEGVNSEIFSLYSRSSSCVSEVNTMETLRGGTSSEPENERDFSSDERNPVIFHDMNCGENYTNNPMSVEFILETNMLETLIVPEEETAGSRHEVSPNFLGTSVAADASNGMGQSEKHLDLLPPSFAPVVDAFEPFQTGQGFSELQCENDFTFQEIEVSPKEINNAENYLTNTIGDPQDGEKTSTIALQAAQQRLSESQYEDVFTLHRTCVSPQDISDAGNSLSADYASDLPNTVGSHCFSEKASPESQDPLSFEEILVYPDEGYKAESGLDNANSSLCSIQVNLTEPSGSYQEGTREQQDENILGFEDIYMDRQEPISENHFNNSGSQDIPDAIMEGAEILSSEILHGSIFSSEGTSVSLDDGNNDDFFCINSGSVMHTAQINTTSLIGLQEGSLEPEDEREINSISPYEIDCDETSSSNSGHSGAASSRYDTGFVETPQELPTDAGSEKVSPKDKKPKDDEFEDMKVDVKDDEDHENNPIGPLRVDEISIDLAPEPSVELYAEDASWRESATGTSNGFEVARVAGLRQRKPAFTVSNSTGSSTVSELAEVQYTEPVDDDTEPLSAPLPASVATDTQTDQMIWLDVFQ